MNQTVAPRGAASKFEKNIKKSGKKKHQGWCGGRMRGKEMKYIFIFIFLAPGSSGRGEQQGFFFNLIGQENGPRHETLTITFSKPINFWFGSVQVALQPI
uniref:Uncharacterized protein n=1 Tax=Anthurium amnicola TaxID=1678845 RepID=A0A1D1Y7B2_9ARAE